MARVIAPHFPDPDKLAVELEGALDEQQAARLGFTSSSLIGLTQREATEKCRQINDGVGAALDIQIAAEHHAAPPLVRHS
jgi:hypothetical protein